jgi:hypothetical protein
MSAAISPSTGQRYGLRRVFRIWEAPRSTVFYRRQERPEPKKRGPKPLIPDGALLQMIREDLANSPFREEGHRKPYYRMKHERKIRVSAKRILRLMRENHLLSPNRAPKGDTKAHDGSISTNKPLEMWGTDGTMAQTVKDGTVWIFGVVEHWNAECVGIHASKSGDRFEAMEPIRQGLKKFYGSLTAKIAAGLALRSDHGCQYHLRPFPGGAEAFRHPPKPRLCGRTSDQRRRGALLEDPQEAGSRRKDLSDPRRSEKSPEGFHGPLQSPLAPRKTRRAYSRRSPESLAQPASCMMLTSGLNNRVRYIENHCFCSNREFRQ